MIAGSIEIQLMANIARLQRDMDDARRVVGNATASMARAADMAKSALAGIAAGLGLRELAQMSDQYAKFTAQLRLATNSTREYGQAYADVKRIASSSQADLAATGTLYARIANGTKDLGIRQQRVADIVEVTNLSLKVSGATSEEASSAILQLSQAFGAGALRGEEFNAVNEAAPRLMKAIADGLGVPVGALKNMATEGKITSQVLASVLPAALGKLRDESKEIQTISGAFTVLKSNVMEFVGAQAQSSGVVTILAGSINVLANNMALMAGAAATVGAVKLGGWLSGMASGALASATANRALAVSNLAAAESNATATAQASLLAGARLAEVRAATLAAAAEVQLALTTNGLIPAQARAAAAAEAHAVAMTQLSVAQRAASVGASTASGIMAALGGPIGALITVLGIAATAWIWYKDKQDEATRDSEKNVGEMTASIVGRIEQQNQKLRERIELSKKAGMADAAKQDGDAVERLAGILANINALKAKGASLSLVEQVTLIDYQGQYADLERVVNANVDLKKTLQDSGVAATELREKLTGVGTSYITDLAKLKKGLDDGLISQNDYATAVKKLANDTFAGSEAGKQFVKGVDLANAAIQRRIEVQTVLNEREKEHIAFLQGSGQINEESAITRTAAVERKALADQMSSIQGQLKLSKSKMNSEVEQAALAGQIAATAQKIDSSRAKEKEDLFALEQKRYRLAVNNSADLIEMDMAELASLKQQTQAQVDQNEQIGLSAKQITALTAMRLEEAAARKDAESITAEGLDLTGERAQRIRDEAAALRERAAAVVSGAGKQELFDKNLQDLNAMVDIMSALDEAAQSAAQGMASAFGSVGQAIGGMTTALTGYERTQAAIAAQLAGSIKDAHGDKVKIERANMMATEASAQAQVRSYGDMASAAKGFFDQNSKGYKVLNGVEKAYRAAEMVMALESMTKKIFFKEAEVAANTALNATKLTGEAATTAASTGLAATEASAWGITAVVKAIASLPFPLNLAAGAATLAAVVGIGAKLVGSMGSGSVSLSEQRQKDQGAGSVLGDSDVKSESLKRALDAVEKNTYQGLQVSGNMLATLRSIDTNIGSFASQLVQSTDVTGKYAATTSSFGGGFLGSVLSSIFGGKTSVQDTGFTLGATSLAQALSGGVTGMQYTDMHKSGGWFSSGSDWTDSKSLGADANAQFTAIIKSLAGSVKTAGELLGISGDDFTAKLNAFVIDIGKVSLKDLKGDDLQKALESVFSKLGDDMASFAVGGLSQFQQVGEGYLETLARAASEYQSIDVVFQSFGKTFGEVGLASIGARDRLVQLAGGLDKFTSQGEYFLTNFFSDKEQAAALKARVQPVLDQYGLQASGEGAMRALRDFVVCLDTTTEAGAQAYTTLMQYAPAVKQIADAEKAVLDERNGLQDQLDQLTMSSAQLLDKQRTALDASNIALFDQIQSIKAQATAATDAAAALQAAKDASAAALQATKDAGTAALANVDNAFSVLQRVTKTTTDAITARITAEKSLSDAVKSTLASMRAQGSEMSERAAAQAQVKAALAITRAGGPLPDAAAMQKSFSVLSQDASSMFATQADYLKDFYSTQNDIAALGDLADSSLSVDQKQLDSLNAMLAADQQQIDLLKGIASALTIQQAQGGFQQALAGAQANSYSGSVAGITSAYASVLGRAPDAAGLEYWKTQAAGGMSIDQITAFMRDSSEAKHLQGIPGFDTGGDHAGGLRFVGETGIELEATGASRIHSTNALMSALRSPSSNNDALLAELKALRQEVATLRQNNSAENVAQVKQLQATVDLLTRVIYGGETVKTEAVTS